MNVAAPTREASEATSVVQYAEWTHAARQDVHRHVTAIAARPGVRRVCDVGGGANPLLPLPAVADLGLRYTVLDIDADELAKAPAGYDLVQADICQPPSSLDGSFDLVCTRMLAEHVPDAAAFHRSVRRMLRPGGYAVHVFPTLYAFPFTVNRALPERVASTLLAALTPGRDRAGRFAKFPADYRWCRGPSRRQLGRLASAGFDVERYVGYFGHADYYDRMPPLRRLHEAKTRWLLRHPVSALTSFSLVVLRAS